MYGKLFNKILVTPPSEIKEDDKVIVGFTEDFLKSHGYKPVIFSDPPEDNNYVEYYTEDENYIYQHWELDPNA